MPGAPRRPRQPRPQTIQCRFEDGRGRCRSIATVEGQLCQRHADTLADRDPIRAAADLLGRRVSKAFGGGADREVQEMMAGVVGQGVAAFIDYLRHQASGPGRRPAIPRAAAAAPPPPPPPPPRASADRLELEQARRVLGFPSSGRLVLAEVLARRRELARKHHPDLGGSVERMQAINAAADLLERHIAA